MHTWIPSISAHMARLSFRNKSGILDLNVLCYNWNNQVWSLDHFNPYYSDTSCVQHVPNAFVYHIPTQLDIHRCIAVLFLKPWYPQIFGVGVGLPWLVGDDAAPTSCQGKCYFYLFLSNISLLLSTILLSSVCTSAPPQVTPKFCKQFGNVGNVINRALSEYKKEVETRTFPGPSHTPYKITPTDVDGFANALQKMGLGDAADAAAAAAENSGDGGPKENSWFCQLFSARTQDLD